MINLLFSIQVLCLAVIVGGGIVLGSGVRPQFIIAMQHAKTTHELETLHINVRNAYNRFSLLSIIFFFLSEATTMAITHQLHVFSITISVILFLLFILKVRVDSKLKNGVLKNERAAESVEQKADHKLVETLSIVILLLSAFEIFFIQ